MQGNVSVTNSMAGKDYADVIDKVAEKVVRSYGIDIAGQAKSLCKVDTGRLRGSITYQTQHYGSSPDQKATRADVIPKPKDHYTCDVGSNVEYAIYMEYGTAKNMTGWPFLRPAVDVVRSGATAAAALEIRRAMKAENAMRYIAIG